MELGQRLKVVFFPGEVGEGKLTMSELSTGNLWDGLGCGGSQKCEIATVEAGNKSHASLFKHINCQVGSCEACNGHVVCRSFAGK